MTLTLLENKTMERRVALDDLINKLHDIRELYNISLTIRFHNEILAPAKTRKYSIEWSTFGSSNNRMTKREALEYLKAFAQGCHALQMKELKLIRSYKND